MRLAFLSFLLLSLPVGALHADFRVYAPSPQSGDLWVIDAVETTDGVAFSVHEKVHIGIPMNRLAAHPEKPILYVTASGGNPGEVPGVTIHLNKRGGEYEKNTPLQFAHGYSYLSTDREANFLMGASYRGGQVDVYNIDATGAVGDRIAYLDEGKKNAHCIIPSPDNRFVYIPYVKDENALFQYAFDAKTGKLSPLDPKDAEPGDGIGPRHIAYHPEKPIIYFSNEQHMGVTAFDIGNDGQLTLRKVENAVPDDFEKDGHSASDIVATVDGQFLFTGIRGAKSDYNKIARYRIDESGDPIFLGMTPADEVPWGLELSPEGRYLLVAAAQAKTLVAYRISESGDLTEAGRFDWAEKITDLIAQ